MRKIWIFLGIALIAILVVAGYFYFTNKKVSGAEINNVQEVTSLSSVENIGESHITFLLNELGASELHNPPVSSEKPVIEIQVGEEKFSSTIDNGAINTAKTAADNPDLRIITSKEEVISALKSGNVKEYIKSSVSNGKTSIEAVASNTKLFLKGYLSLYNDLKG